MRVLLVEDGAALAQDIRMALRGEGYTLDWVADGPAAERFDLVRLRPLQDFARGLRARDPHSLAPLLAGPLPPELQPMRGALLERERRFIADAAHELRTPLAILDLPAQNAQRVETATERDEALGIYARASAGPPNSSRWTWNPWSAKNWRH